MPGEDPIETNEIVHTGKQYAFLRGDATPQMRQRRRPAVYVFVDLDPEEIKQAAAAQ